MKLLQRCLVADVWEAGGVAGDVVGAPGTSQQVGVGEDDDGPGSLQVSHNLRQGDGSLYDLHPPGLCLLEPCVDPVVIFSYDFVVEGLLAVARVHSQGDGGVFELYPEPL